MSNKSKASPLAQADLILKLYELRREAVMREARSYIGGSEFLPASADELVAIVTTGGRKGGFVLQVYGYWDMVAAFVRQFCGAHKSSIGGGNQCAYLGDSDYVIVQLR